MNVLLMNCSPVRDGATAEIIHTVHSFLGMACKVRSICIDDYDIKFCKGCRSCHKTARCVQDDDMIKVMTEFAWADTIVCVSPSYWADVPGQFKAFIDRCTPWCNTHEPHAVIGGTVNIGRKTGYTIALRTGPNMKECKRIIESIEHFYGHLEIQPGGSLGLCSVEYKEAVEARKDEIRDFCRKILNAGK